MRRIVFTIFILLHNVLSRTQDINADSCFKDPASPIVSDGVVLFVKFYRGTSTCYVKPTSSGHYFDIRIDDLHLEQEEKCASFVISEYSAVFGEKIPGGENSQSVLLQRPGDAIVLMKASCKDYNQFVNRTFSTSAPGRKIMVDFTDIFGEKMSSFRLTITAYYVSQFSSCRADYFLCWNGRGRCIPSSLTCDGVYNCLDGSDEKNFSCTGMIGGLPVAWFVILIIVSIVCLISSIAGTIILVRRNRLRRSRVPESIPMTIISSTPAVQHPLMTAADL